MIKMYNQIPIEQRRELKKQLLELRDLRKRQLAQFEKLIKPYQDSVKMIDKVFKNEITLEQFQHHQNYVSKYSEDFAKCFLNHKK